MRCNNCGWDNPAGLMRCEKCNAPLKGSMVQHNEPEKKDVPVSKTIKGKQPNVNEYLDKQHVKKEEPEKKEQDKVEPENICPNPNCGYELLPGALKCPECGYEIEKSRKRNIDENIEDNKNKQQKPIGGTIDPWQQAKHTKCYLQPMAREGENSFQPQEFSGDAITLNRENLEKDNLTITSKTQAVIQKIDGKWYIVDRSSRQTTFIHVSEPVEIKSGDIILMGDRKFQFDC